MGVVSPIGTGREEFSRSLRDGRCGVRHITLFDASHLPTRIAAEVPSFPTENLIPLPELTSRIKDRRVLLGLSAAHLAVEDANIDRQALRSPRCGVILGSGLHPVVPSGETILSYGLFGDRRRVELLEEENQETAFSPGWGRVTQGATLTAERFGMKGPCYTNTSACAAASQAIGQAFQLIAEDRIDSALAGGYDSMIFPFGVLAFSQLGTMTTRNDEPQRAIRPFDRNRDGFALGEGAGIVLLEEWEKARKRGAPIYAEVIGYGTSVDAYRITDPHPDGKGAFLAMKRAVQSAAIPVSAVDYINAHGTATAKNDKMETKAIKQLFGEHARRTPVSSIKAMIGHLVSAAGALELIATVISAAHSFIPPTINYESPDPQCDLDYVPNVARDARVDVALSNSFGFGGQNASLIIRKGP
jgi:3-oxoacyl-[acyl-carrier-protein] synthase II